jgi:hypothetical protein
MKITKTIEKTFQKYNVLRKYSFIILMVIVGLPSALLAQEKQDTVKVSQEQKDKFNEIKKAADDEKLEKGIKQDGTGNDPRAFNNKWMPFYRYTELENGLIQQDLTPFGTIAFSDVVGVFYELPLARYRDLSGISGLPEGVPTDAIGVGDMSLKFLIRPKALDFSATVPSLAGNAFVFAPILALVIDTPLHGFFAMLNLYYFDVFKLDSAPKTSRYVGRWFYMQPLTPPGEWWGLFFLMPEFQPIYDFETKDFSLWIGVELGKILVPGQVAYVKPGWGIDNSSELDLDRKFTFED